MTKWCYSEWRPGKHSAVQSYNGYPQALETQRLLKHKIVHVNLQNTMLRKRSQRKTFLKTSFLSDCLTACHTHITSKQCPSSEIQGCYYRRALLSPPFLWEWPLHAHRIYVTKPKRNAIIITLHECMILEKLQEERRPRVHLQAATLIFSFTAQSLHCCCGSLSPSGAISAVWYSLLPPLPFCFIVR